MLEKATQRCKELERLERLHTYEESYKCKHAEESDYKHVDAENAERRCREAEENEQKQHKAKELESKHGETQKEEHKPAGAQEVVRKHDEAKESKGMQQEAAEVEQKQIKADETEYCKDEENCGRKRREQGELGKNNIVVVEIESKSVECLKELHQNVRI